MAITVVERKIEMYNKKLILVASPPACGKTYLAKRLAKALDRPVYLDKDALNPFGKQICRLSAEPYNPDSEFFRREVREIEYQVTMDIALEALVFSEAVIVNAPFGKELWDTDYMNRLKDTAAELGARLFVVFIDATPDICRERMIERNNVRDKWKLENWEEYVSGVNFKAPTHLSEILDLFLYHNATDEIADASFAELLKLLNK